ncbi:MAG: MFS transporter [Acidimicrobiales bacterium]
MRTTTNRFETDDAGLAALLVPRDDLLAEEPLADVAADVRRFGCAEGPFDEYVRTVAWQPTADGRHAVVEEVRWAIAIPIWGRLFRPLVRRQLERREAPGPADPDADPSAPWWSPPARLDARAARVLSRLCGLSMLAGYLGTTISQTLTFAADEFGASKADQGATLSAVRVGVLLSLALMAAADRRGRKRLLTVCAIGGAVASFAGALSPSMWALGGTQTVARAFSTALALLIAVVAAEEMPAGGRAYAASVLAMTGALGGGLAVILVSFADAAPWAWRIVYVVPVLLLPGYLRIAGRLPESRRFVRPHGRATLRGHRGRLALLMASGFFGLLFLAPVSQFQNDFLKDEHGFTAPMLALFTLATNTPGGIGIVVGGRLADVRGRRMVGAIGTIGGAALLAVGYQVSGALLWLTFTVGTVVAAVTVPALGVYGPELFPTALRGKANGLITLGGVAGSSVGLSIAGHLGDRYGTLGPGIALLALGPLVVAALVLALYPETAHVELEELNPEDAPATGFAPPLT